MNNCINPDISCINLDISCINPDISINPVETLLYENIINLKKEYNKEDISNTIAHLGEEIDNINSKIVSILDFYKNLKNFNITS